MTTLASNSKDLLSNDKNIEERGNKYKEKSYLNRKTKSRISIAFDLCKVRMQTKRIRMDADIFSNIIMERLGGYYEYSLLLCGKK